MRLGITHLGNIDVAVRAMANRLDVDLVTTPPTTLRTLSLGVKYSPETVCLPFKLQLGNMIEALEQGADTLVMPGGPGPCRFGYYHKVHEPILRELGYKFDLVTQNIGVIGMVKYLTQGTSLREVLAAVYFGISKLKAVEKVERMVHKVRPMERDRGETSRVFRECLKAIDSAGDYRTLAKVVRTYLSQLKSLPVAESPAPLKVGITGEFFIVIDHFANMDIEVLLGNLGVEVKRTIFLNDYVRLNPLVYYFGLLEKHKSHKAAMQYISHHIGGDGWQSVGEKVLHAGDWDGIVHLEPFGCMPEITARNIMSSTKEKLPVLNIIYDEHTGKAGLMTRLEAFVDMLSRKRRHKASL